MFEIYWPEKCKGEKYEKFCSFVQKQANRLVVGIFRYDDGLPTRRAKFLTRLKAEIAEYERTGNTEHLINASNYCYLESNWPEHKNSRYEHIATSVTRDKLKMKDPREFT